MYCNVKFCNLLDSTIVHNKVYESTQIEPNHCHRKVAKKKKAFDYADDAPLFFLSADKKVSTCILFFRL